MQNAHFSDLWLKGIKSGSSSTMNLDLSCATVDGVLRIDDCRIGDLTAKFLEGKGPCVLSSITLVQQLDLGYARFARLEFSDSRWLDNIKQVSLEGTQYAHITLGKDMNWRDLIRLADQSEYSASVYQELEAYFERTGYPARADKVFVAQKWRETRDLLRRPVSIWNLVTCGKNVAMRALVRNGRSPEFALLWCLLWILIGCRVFRQDKMEPIGIEAAARSSCSALWYSVDLFVPFVSLGAKETTEPKDTSKFAWFYRRLLPLLGFVFISILVAAWTGIIK